MPQLTPVDTIKTYRCIPADVGYQSVSNRQPTEPPPDSLAFHLATTGLQRPTTCKVVSNASAADNERAGIPRGEFQR
jgi:hypothetical protein